MSPGNSLTGQRPYEFGSFRLNPVERVLEGHGRPLSIAPKTLEVLIVLVENRGHIVEKEELMRKVWPDTFVEENNLAFHVSVLRKLFEENSASPRYIETISKRGYRFIADVIQISANGAGEIETIEPPPAPAHAVPAKRRFVRLQAFLIALATLALLVVILSRVPRAAKLSDSDVIVLADFVNKTGDPVSDGTLQQGLAVQLKQSPFLSLLSESRVRHLIQLMGQPADARLTPELARDICERTASAAVLEGSIARLGNQYVLGLRAKNCSSGEVLDDEQVQGARKEDVLNALSQMARNFRLRAGESLATIRSHDTPLAEATTPSLEALKAYSSAWKILAARGATAALPLFQRAAQLDPEFAMAHASLGRMYADLDQSDLSMRSVERAWQLRSRASDRERFFITLNYEMLVTGDLEEARKTGEAWAQTYPRDASPHVMLSGYVNKFPGRYEDAAAEARKAIELDPDFGVGYYNLAVNNAYLERLDEAERVLQGGEARGLEPDEFLMLAFDLAFLRKDRAAMQRVSERARRKSGPESWISNKEAFADAYFGRLQQARNVSHRAVAEAEEGGQEERAALWEVGAAVREALFGNARQAKEKAKAALALSHDREVQYGTAFAFASAGDTFQAETLADELERRFPKDSCVRFSYLPVLGAMLAMNRREPLKAIEILHRAASYEMGAPRSSINALFGAMYPVYVRGEAYLALHQSAAAAAEFQKILDHRGIVVSDPIGALARLQLGRAFALSGDKAQAKAAYDDFLSLWKDADSDIPIFRRAKAEYAKLQ